MYICNECVVLAVEIIEKDVEGYEDRKLAVEIHSDLCTVEKLNEEDFGQIGAYIKGVMHALQTKPHDQENQSDTE